MIKDLGFSSAWGLGDQFGIPTCMGEIWDFYQDGHLGGGFGIFIWMGV